ncbi:ricin-type beta-trefoil lectin domain protein [Kitasatospora sp. NPDC052868]|uniref:ricin-type beta-trefoil lectin domain protein n=1 Tax=Kitasatospora sp. NPDC052868 TaxID=3364060 RepID=UPI0037C9C7E7
MRRIAAVFATVLLAGAAALAAPAANAQPVPQAATQAAAPAAVTQAEAQAAGTQAVTGGCTVTLAGDRAIGTCSGMDPMQTWRVAAWCQGWDGTSQTWLGTTSGWVTGNGTTFAPCFSLSMASYGQVVLGSAVPAGPVGQISGYANKCVDVRGGSNANGTPVQIWDCLGNTSQAWKIGADGTLRALGKCLDVKGGGTGNATVVQTYDCNGTGAQQWQVRADGSILNPQSGRCLDDLGFSTTNGNQLGIWDCNGYANQVWHLPA